MTTSFFVHNSLPLSPYLPSIWKENIQLEEVELKGTDQNYSIFILINKRFVLKTLTIFFLKSLSQSLCLILVKLTQAASTLLSSLISLSGRSDREGYYPWEDHPGTLVDTVTLISRTKKSALKIHSNWERCTWKWYCNRNCLLKCDWDLKSLLGTTGKSRRNGETLCPRDPDAIPCPGDRTEGRSESSQAVQMRDIKLVELYFRPLIFSSFSNFFRFSAPLLSNADIWLV